MGEKLVPDIVSPERRQELFAAVQAFIDQNYITRRLAVLDDGVRHSRKEAAAHSAPPQFSASKPQSSEDDWDILACIFARPDAEAIHDLIEEAEKEETFSEALLRLIQEKQLTEPEVYNSVFMDRKLFNKIRNTPEYQPSKRTALLLAVALKLDLEQTQEFIGKAGFQLVHWNKSDLIVEYFIRHENYNIFEINEMLASFKVPLLLRCN